MPAVMVTVPWVWRAAGPVGPGEIHRQASVIELSATDAGGASVLWVLDALTPGDVLRIGDPSHPGEWWVYVVNGPPAPALSGVPAAHHLTADDYSGGFIRVSGGGIGATATTADVALAVSPGPGGAVYPAVDAIPDAAVWFDNGGALGHVRHGDGSDVTGADLRGWITTGAVLTVHRDETDAAHPALVVTDATVPVPSGDRWHVPVSAGGHGPAANPADGAAVSVIVIDADAAATPPPPDTAPVPPTRTDLLAYLGPGYRDPGTPVDDALAAAISAQATRCVTDPYTIDLRVAALRRAAAILAAANAPLGVADLGDLGGAVTIPRWDTITQALEAPYLRPVFA